MTSDLMCGVCNDWFQGEQSSAYEDGTGVCDPCEKKLREDWNNHCDDQEAKRKRDHREQ